MTSDVPQTVHLKDYEKPLYSVSNVDLSFDLDWEKTVVTSKMKMKINHDTAKGVRPLVLDGEDLVFVSAKVDGKPLQGGQFEVKDDSLTIRDLPSEFELEIINEINPSTNKALEGLYKSGGILCTQNESEGFRRITYFQDRPDVMAKYTTRITADKKEFPILLSNGNKIDEGTLDNGKHWALWEDPFNKPCYLYALVAGDFGMIEDYFTTVSGRKVTLQVFCDRGNESKCYHAMESLKKSMKWDEEVFGLEYDLDLYMIVAVDSFNAGAMENKGLNIFNSALTLADQKTATDNDFLRIESVIGHEYFHNWTGNRVTCRDWFQLTLKEGLTVFRDQQFSGDMNSTSVQRISDVLGLRAGQFPEDAGPMAHPIKPKSYMSIDNFYSATVYEKGAEVIRMAHTLLGEEGFKKGITKYFELYDGGAVTTEDFLHALSVANDNYDFSQFILWYDQSGTPEVKVGWSYDKDEKRLSMTFTQSCPPTPGQDTKEPYHMPFKMGLISESGREFPLVLASKDGQPQLDEGVLHLRRQTETFDFLNVEESVIPSLNRGFSAPIKLNAEYCDNDLVFLMANDSDEFNRYEAAQQLGIRVINGLIHDQQQGKSLSLHKGYSDAFGKILADSALDNSIKAECLTVPMESMITSNQNPIDYASTISVRDFVAKALAVNHKDELLACYEILNVTEEFAIDPKAMGKRSLKNKVLSFLSHIPDDHITNKISAQFSSANNMTDEYSAFNLLLESKSELREESRLKFFEKYSDDTLVMQKWFAAQSSSHHEDTFKLVKELESHPRFDKTIPNFVRSLFGGFTRNSRFFHATSGEGYKFIADKVIEMDKINPQVGAGLARSFREFKKLVPESKALMEKELRRVLDTDGLSKNVYEIISKTLK